MIFVSSEDGLEVKEGLNPLKIASLISWTLNSSRKARKLIKEKVIGISN
jgi:hypothetical protein